MQFTIPDDVLKMEHERCKPLTKEQLIDTYSDVFNLPVESLPDEVHFELDTSVTLVQCAPQTSKLKVIMISSFGPCWSVAERSIYDSA